VGSTLSARILRRRILGVKSLSYSAPTSLVRESSRPGAPTGTERVVDGSPHPLRASRRHRPARGCPDRPGASSEMPGLCRHDSTRCRVLSGMRSGTSLAGDGAAGSRPSARGGRPAPAVGLANSPDGRGAVRRGGLASRPADGHRDGAAPAPWALALVAGREFVRSAVGRAACDRNGPRAPRAQRRRSIAPDVHALSVHLSGRPGPADLAG